MDPDFWDTLYIYSGHLVHLPLPDAGYEGEQQHEQHQPRDHAQQAQTLLPHSADGGEAWAEYTLSIAADHSKQCLSLSISTVQYR